jgi:hypothetical protein
MLKRIAILLAFLILLTYIVLEVFIDGYLSPNKIVVESQRINLPKNYVIFQVNKEGKLYNLFNVPFLDLRFSITQDFEGSGISLKNKDTKNVMFMHFAKYLEPMYKKYYALLVKEKYTIRSIGKCRIAHENTNNEEADIYIYKSKILYHFMGNNTIGNDIIKQICIN